jgi:hypothetical protein
VKKIHIIGGGTFNYVRNHLALAAPAFGNSARALHEHLAPHIGDPHDYDVNLHLTKMADYRSPLVTNADVSTLLEKLVADPDTRCIILNAALCDYTGSVVQTMDQEWEDKHLAHIRGEGPPANIASGPHAPRLKTSDGTQMLTLQPASKLIGKIRKERKDIFVVGFKTTTDATSDEQYRIALDMLKRDSLNLVLANDTVTRNNMIVAPEETRYSETTDRAEVLAALAKMVRSRIENTYTRSTVVEGDSVSWDSPMIPENLRAVVDYCIERGAYKPFRGVTAGHFAVKLDEGRIITSKRKRNFNELSKEGLVLVEYEGDNKVIAYGAKPSVGGQSQRVVFREHPELDCIVHFHSPLRENHPDAVPVASQWENECGSHQCGQNTSRNLSAVNYRRDMKVVMLDGHGPNIVFSRHTPANDVIEFINANFDLEKKTGGMVA